MSKRCTLCKCNPNKYWNLFNGGVEDFYKLFDFCQHNINLIDKNICIKCTINNIRHENKLQNIYDKDLISMTCIKWKTGESTELYCWKNKVPMCDVLNCNYPAVKKYVQLEQFINDVKNNFYLAIYVPTEIFNIIIKYTYNIHPTKNGLCITHNTDYNTSIEKIFNCESQCTLCTTNMSCNYQYGIIKELTQNNNYFYRNITLYHKPSDLCNKIILIDGIYYFNGGCLELCKQLNTWCEICNYCIGHTIDINKIYTHNIFKYPHCKICNKHSEYSHCQICNIHLQYPHCQICNKHSEYSHCQICNKHSKYSHCEICNKHLEYPHCEICNEHSKYSHCQICNKHYGFKHCEICNEHYEYQHCQICDRHYEYQHCDNCWNIGHEISHHEINKICKKIDYTFL
jgi:hypothetical protein